MSEIKKCPCCNSEDITEGSVILSIGEDIYIKCRTCGLKMQICSEYGWKELKKRWNTRKPIEKILKRLEDENMTAVDSSNIFCSELADGKVEGLERAIEIIKEEVE